MFVEKDQAYGQVKWQPMKDEAIRIHLMYLLDTIIIGKMATGEG